MTNTYAPFGFQQIQRYDGGSPTMGMTRVAISSTDATPIFSGDVVQNAGYTVGSGSFAEYITQASSGLTTNTAWRGVFNGCEYLNTAVGRVVWSPYWPGSGAGADAIAYIYDDPSMLFIAQCSTVFGTPVGSSQVGMNVSMTTNGVAMTSSIGNTTTGLSGIGIASSATASTATLPWRIRDFYSNYAPGQIPGAPSNPANTAFVNGTDNTTPGQILVVQMNNFTNKNTTGL